MDDATLRGMILDTLNERQDPGRHFITKTIDYAIQLAKATVFTLTGDGSQETLQATANGSSKIPIDAEIMRIIRVDSVGGCGLPMKTVKEAGQITSGWRGCDYTEGEEPTGYVLDPDSPTSLWIVQAPAPGTVIEYTALVTDSATTPTHLLPAVRHFALAYAYEKAYGNNQNADIHRSRGYDYLQVYRGVIENG